MQEKLGDNLMKHAINEEISWNGSFDIESIISEATHTKNTLKGVVMMVLASLLFGLMGFAIKVTYIKAPGIGAFDILLIRSLIMIPVYYIYAKTMKVDLWDISFK